MKRHPPVGAGNTFEPACVGLRSSLMHAINVEPYVRVLHPPQRLDQDVDALGGIETTEIANPQTAHCLGALKTAGRGSADNSPLGQALATKHELGLGHAIHA